MGHAWHRNEVTTLLLPTTLSDEPTVPPDVRVVRYDVGEPVPDDALDAEALVRLGQRAPSSCPTPPAA